MVRKFQFGGPGYFIGSSPLITPESIDSGTKQVAGGFNWLMGNLGKAFNTVLTAGASTDFGQTSPFTFSSGEERKNIARARERTRLKANKVIEENSVYISPTSYVAAITLGSLNPKVGAEVLSKDPRLQALGILGDLLTFRFGPKAIKNTPAAVDKVLAATGSKGAKGRVVAREMNRTLLEPIDLKNPFRWWNNVEVVGNPAQQITHPWQLSNSKYSRFQLSNGKIRLLLPSHTESAPRLVVLESLGNNKYYVHMRTWDGDKVPANMSSAEKNTLFEALYNELPDGAEILFPQSGPGNYATRGTVAGLLHLSRDPRFTPGTKGTLYYLDKDGKTIRTYEGTSFIKSPLNSYEFGPVLRGTDYANYVNTIKDKYINQGARVEPIEQNPTLTAISDRTGFVPMFLMWPGKRLRAHAKEITRRLEQQGMDVDKQTANIPGVGEGTVREVIDKNVGLPSYIGYFRRPGISGSYNKKTGITLVDPTEHDKTVTTMQHERNMHGTLRILTDKMWEPYLNFLDNIFKDRDIKITEINNKKYYSVTDPDNAVQEFPITGDAFRKEELRATLGLYRKDLYDLVAYPRAKVAGLDIKPDDLEGLRPFFELAVDELTIPLVKLDLHSINAYGRTYAKLGPKWNPNFLEELKQLLKYSPGVLPFMYNEEK